MVALSARFRPNPRLARWLRCGAPDGEGVGEGGGGPDWDGWLLRRMTLGEIVTVGGVLVDRAVLRQRFACVSERCAPRPGRGEWRSCCADVAVWLEAGERRRLERVRGALRRELGVDRWCDAGYLARPQGRCAFARLAPRSGRLRCRLHAWARQRGIDRADVQPLSCRLFPLIVVDFGEGRTALTLVSASTWRRAGAWQPRRYPCLADRRLPSLYRSLCGDLDWAFGRGFARALERVATGR